MKILLSVLIGTLLFSCSGGDGIEHIYNGRLESDVVRISAQSAGIVDSLMVEEGQATHKGELLAVINSDKIRQRLRQQRLQEQEVTLNLQGLQAGLKELDAQIELTRSTLVKTNKMVSAGAATDQKRDEIQTQVTILTAKKEALMARMNALANKKEQIAAAIDLTRLSLQDTRIVSPLKGRLLNQFIYRGELTVPGKPLFEIADLSRMEAVIYLPLEELGNIKPGQKAEITVDGQENRFEGSVKWISSTSEFTPKTILTKETRTTLVYQVKVDVPNPDGILKIGMPVDVAF